MTRPLHDEYQPGYEGGVRPSAGDDATPEDLAAAHGADCLLCLMLGMGAGCLITVAGFIIGGI